MTAAGYSLCTGVARTTRSCLHLGASPQTAVTSALAPLVAKSMALNNCITNLVLDVTYIAPNALRPLLGCVFKHKRMKAVEIHRGLSVAHLQDIEAFLRRLPDRVTKIQVTVAPGGAIASRWVAVLREAGGRDLKLVLPPSPVVARPSPAPSPRPSSPTPRTALRPLNVNVPTAHPVKPSCVPVANMPPLSGFAHFPSVQPPPAPRTSRLSAVLLPPPSPPTNDGRYLSTILSSIDEASPIMEVAGAAPVPQVVVVEAAARSYSPPRWATPHPPAPRPAVEDLRPTSDILGRDSALCLPRQYGLRGLHEYAPGPSRNSCVAPANSNNREPLTSRDALHFPPPKSSSQTPRAHLQRPHVLAKPFRLPLAPRNNNNTSSHPSRPHAPPPPPAAAEQPRGVPHLASAADISAIAEELRAIHRDGSRWLHRVEALAARCDRFPGLVP